MTEYGDDVGRQIVSCDDCGTPYPAVESDGDLVLIGNGGGACPNCDSQSFSAISL
jgi:hypothetical protein